MPAVDMSNAVALVTGGNRGIGLGIASAMAEAGAKVVIWGRSEARNVDAAAKLASLGAEVLAQTVDVSSEKQVIAAMAQVMDRFGRVDAVVANSGISGSAEHPWAATTANLERVLTVNLSGTFWTLREGAKAMLQRDGEEDRGGALIAITSTAAFQGAPMMAQYSASKGAIEAYVRSLAVDLGSKAIRANTIVPGFIASEMLAEIPSSIMERDYLPRIPLGRVGAPEEVGDLAVFLSSRASRYITGMTFRIDGGYSIN